MPGSPSGFGWRYTRSSGRMGGGRNAGPGHRYRCVHSRTARRDALQVAIEAGIGRINIAYQRGPSEIQIGRDARSRRSCGFQRDSPCPHLRCARQTSQALSASGQCLRGSNMGATEATEIAGRIFPRCDHKPYAKAHGSANGQAGNAADAPGLGPRPSLARQRNGSGAMWRGILTSKNPSIGCTCAASGRRRHKALCFERWRMGKRRCSWPMRLAVG